MKLCLLLRGLMVLYLFVLGGCGDSKGYYYTDGATLENPWPSKKDLDPFVFDAGFFANEKKIEVGISMSKYPIEKYKDVSIEFDCSELEVLVEGKKLKPLRVMCPLGKEFLELKRISADFATPDGRPSKAVVTFPGIKITSMDSHEQIKEFSKFAVTYTLQEYERPFGVR